MLINRNENAQDRTVKFISYTGKWPCLCSGLLTLEIEGKKVTFGHDYATNKRGMFDSFWRSGGECGFTNDYSNSYVHKGEWIIDVSELPDCYKHLAEQIDSEFNANVPFGCCGGCL